jgi:hypothetical protein
MEGEAMTAAAVISSISYRGKKKEKMQLQMQV